MRRPTKYDILCAALIFLVMVLMALVATVGHAAPAPVLVSWEKPTKNVDGSELLNLTGYNVYVYPAGAKTPSQVVLVRGGTSTSSTIVMENSCVSVTSLTTDGGESSLSNFACIGNATPPDLPNVPPPTGPAPTIIIYVGPAPTPQ